MLSSDNDAGRYIQSTFSSLVMIGKRSGGILHPCFPGHLQLTIDDIAKLKERLYQQVKSTPAYSAALQNITMNKNKCYSALLLVAGPGHPTINAISKDNTPLSIPAFTLLKCEPNWSEFTSDIAADLGLSGNLNLIVKNYDDRAELNLQWSPWS